LRTAFPSSIPTDSKAIILRKAVLHINHLEGLLRDAGIGYAGPPTPTRGDWGEEDVKEDVEMAEGGVGSCRDRERERERGEDVRPRRGS